MRKILLPLILFLPVCLLGQQHYRTQVSAVVKDQFNNLYANGSWEANLDLANVPPGTLVKFQGSTAFQTSYSGQLDSAAKFSASLPDNNVIIPIGDTQWDFKFCEHYTTATQSPAPACFGLTLLITGVSEDITTQVQAASVPLNPINSGSVTGSLFPSVDNSWSLGSPSLRWANLYATNATLANPLSISSGGTGTSSPAMTAGGGIALSGSFPNYSISNTDDAYFSGGILTTAHGGTSTATPSLAAGQNIAISGPWPNQTVAVSNLQGTDSKLLTAGTVSGTGAPLCSDSAGGATTSGCSAGGVPVVAKVDLTTQTASISNTTIYTPSAAGFYRVTVTLFETDAGSGTLTASINFESEGNSFTKQVANTSTTAGAPGQGSGTISFFATANTAIKYSTTFTPNTAPYSYDVHVRVEGAE